MTGQPTDAAVLTRALLRVGATVGTELFAHTGLHTSDVRALQVLDHAAGSPPTPAELAEALDRSRPAITALVDRLEDAGLVERRPDQHDRRRVRIHLTPAAHRLGQHLLQPLATAVDRAAAGLDHHEAAVVSRYLEAVLADIP